eukprot:3834637-Lingulodinium_polyedra.AAC.1
MPPWNCPRIRRTLGDRNAPRNNCRPRYRGVHGARAIPKTAAAIAATSEEALRRATASCLREQIDALKS